MATKKSTVKRRTTSSRVTKGSGGLKLNKRFNSPLAFLLIILAAVAGGFWVWRSFAVTGKDYVYLNTYAAQDSNAGRKILRIAADGSGTKQVLYTKDQFAPLSFSRSDTFNGPSVSPSGNLLAFSLGKNNGGASSDATGSVIKSSSGEEVNVIRRLQMENSTGGFEWFADETTLLGRSGNTLFSINKNGSNKRVLYTSPTTTSEGSIRCAKAQPRAPGLVVFKEWYFDGNNSIKVMNKDGSNVRTVAQSPNPELKFQLSCPTWSRDGNKIVYSEQTTYFDNKVDQYPPEHNIVVSTIGGVTSSSFPRIVVAQGAVTDEPFGSTPSIWSPDSKSVLFTQRNFNVESLFKINIESRQMVLVASEPRTSKTKYVNYGWGKNGWIVYMYEDRTPQQSGTGTWSVRKSGPAIVRSVNSNGTIKKVLYREPSWAINDSILVIDELDMQ